MMLFLVGNVFKNSIYVRFCIGECSIPFLPREFTGQMVCFDKFGRFALYTHHQLGRRFGIVHRYQYVEMVTDPIDNESFVFFVYQ